MRPSYIFAFVFSFSLAVAGIPSAEELEEVTVTATKTPRKAEETSAAVDVVTKDDIAETTGWNVGEALSGLAGVQAESSNGAYDTHIIIRGAGAKAAYGVREIMIMVDGVPITDPDSLTRLDMVDTSIIERIEVVKGPNSTLYGANAAGGVVNIITKSPMEAEGLMLKAGYGSNNSHHLHAQYAAQLEEMGYLISGTWRETDSWREHNEFSTVQLNGRAVKLMGDSDLDLSVSYTKADLQLPGSLTKAEFDADPSQQASDWTENGRYSEARRLALSYHGNPESAVEVSATAYVQDWEHYHPVPTGINDGGAVVMGAELQGNIRKDLAGKKNVLTLGLSLQQDRRDSDKYTYRDLNTGIVNAKVVAIMPYASSDEAGSLMEHSENTVDKWGIFAQDSLWVGEKTVLDIGARYDSVKFEIDEQVYKSWSYITSSGGVSYFNYTDTPESNVIEKTWKAVSTRAGLNHELAGGLNVYAAAATGFQTPTQSELVTNSGLKPQTTVNYETGLKYRHERGHSMELAVFYTDIEDEVIKLVDAAGTTYYDNAGSTVHKGVELSAEAVPAENFTLGLNYAYSDFRFRDYDENERVAFPPPAKLIVHERDGNRLPLVPVHKISLSAGYKSPKGPYVRLTSNTWGKYYVDTANSETYAGFTVLNTKLGYKKESLDVYLMVDNMADRKYASEVTKSYGNTRYSPGAPRTWTAGVEYTF